jgi:outer membrane immunogenic protein
MKLRIGIACLASSFLVGGAFAADLPVTQLYRPAPSIPQRAVEWTGLYFGVNAGYGSAHDESNIVFAGGFAGGTTTLFGLGATELSRKSVTGSAGLRGPIAGGQIGFNWQSGMVVFGAEVDGQWSGQRSTFTANCGAGCTAIESVRLRSIATVRARVGLAFDWLMPYVTAGGAFVNALDSLTMTVGGVTANFLPLSNTTLGWTAGAGIEVALWGNWSAKLEYLHISANNVTSTTSIPGVLGLGGASEGADYRDNIVRAGLNYRFGPSGGPGILAAASAPRAGYAGSGDFLRNVKIATERATNSVKHALGPPAVVEDDAKQIAAASGSNRQQPLKWGEEVEDFELASAEPSPPKPSSRKRRENQEDESQRMNRIMAICEGC